MGTLTTLESFTGGVDGGSPGYGSLLIDANGNLFGTTLSGGTAGGGTVFELVNTGSGFTLQTLASFDPNDTVNGNSPFAGLTMDANGNLFGVTQAGGASGSGTVFEIANTGSGYGALQTLASFSGATNGSYPTGTLLTDANGDLFGTTQSGGANGQGTVFEMVHSGSGYSLQTLYTFNFTDGAAPTGALIADGNGNLFGTTLQGGAGAQGQGTVFELVNTGSGYSLQTLASFDGANGSFLYAGVTADAQGNLFGATYSGGAGGYGTIYELVNTGSGFTYQTLATLDYNVTGAYSIGGLTVDAQGDVFGTALAGGANSFGTVFELVHGSSGYTLQVLYAFGGADGAMPEGTLTLDAAGNLYGTTAGGGTDGAGTVFEIASAAPSNEQAQLALKVNGGFGNPIGAAGEHNVAFTVAGLEAGDTGVVTFTDAANNTVTVNVAAGQTHYTADFSALTDGAVSASLQVATNSLGVSFTPVSGNTVTLDTAAPGQPGAPADGAVSNGYVDGAHDTAGQTIGGAAEAGALVAIYDNGTHVATVTADGSGAWTYQVGSLTDGSSHSYAVTATDAAGNVSPMSAALAFTVDTSAPAKPAAPVDAGVSNGWVNAAHDTANQTIGGTTEAGASVVIYDNGIQIASVTADGTGAWSYQVGILADGSSHAYAVTATDAAGNTSTISPPMGFTVDTHAPAQPAAPTDGSVSGGYVNAAHDTAGQALGGQTEAGATVTVYDNGTQIGTAVANGAGAWSFQVGALADGSAHSYAVTSTDAAGNTSAMSAALGFTVDTSAPGQPGAPADAAVNNGYVNAAHDTAGQAISGTTEAGASVAIYDNGTQVGTVTADGAGAWSYQVGVLADGSAHSYAVTSTDAAGNTSTMSAALGFTVDTSAPGQPAAPTDGAVSSGYVNAAHDTAAQAISGTAEAGATVAVYDNGTQVASVTADGSGAWSYQVGALADGSAHSYAVTATDAAGNTSAMSPALSFTVDTSAPGQPAAPADPSVSNGIVDAAHDTAAQAISGTTEAGATVAVYDNGTHVATVTADGSGAWSYQVGALADGSSHSYAVTSTDAAGNTSAMGQALSFTVDTSGPPQPAAPSDASVSGGYVNAAHDTAGQTLNGTTVAGATVAVYDNGTQVATVTADGSGAWSYQVGVLADGSTHSYAVTASDGGAASPMSGALSFTVDTSAPGQPGAPADASVSGGYVNAAHDTAGHTIGGTTEAGVTVAVYDNGTHVATVVADGSGAWSYQVGALADGSSHSYAVASTDAAGNTSALSAALSFTVDASAPAQPGAPTDASVSGGYLNAAHDTAGHTIGGTAEAGASVVIYDNGALVTTVAADNAGAWTYQVGALADGSAHSYAVTATDAAGNTSAMSAALSFTVDTSAPASAVAGVTVGGDGAAMVSGSAEAGSIVTLYDGGSAVGAVTAGAGGTWSYPVGVLAAGSDHSYTVTATDAAGNTSAVSGALGYTAPSAPVDPPSNPPSDPPSLPDPPPQPATPTDAAVHNGWVNAAGDTAGQTIGGTAVAGDLVTIYDQGSKVTTVTADGTGAWSYQVGVLANGSSHSYAVTDTDGGGNVSPMSAALSFTVDTAAPGAPTGLADAAISNGYVNKAHDTAGQSLTGQAEAGSVITVYDNGTSIGTATANASTGAWSFNLGVLANGVQTLTTTATDAAGNTGVMSQPLSFTVDTAPPVPVVTNVTDAGKGMSTVSGTSEAGSTVSVFDGGQQVGVVTAAANGTWSLTLKLNGGQVHQFTETAVDLAGNTGASTGSGYWANPANKSFSGGSGDDVFIGQKGDTFACGSGHDHLVFNTGFGRETVSGFASGSDQIWLDHTLFGSFAAVMAGAVRIGGDTLISTGAGDQLQLHGVLPTALHAGDFHFF